MEKNSRKLSIDFPTEEYMYLKMACAKQGISVKDFVTKAIIRLIEEYEDELDGDRLGQSRKEVAESGAISWEELEKRLGWDSLK